MKITSIPYILFLGGFAYYGVLPVAFFYFFQDYQTVRIAMSNFGNQYFLELYSGLAFVYFISFSTGYYLSQKYSDIQPSIKKVNYDKNLRRLIVGLYMAIALVSLNVQEIVSLVGYSGEYDVAHRGQLTTLYLTSIWWFIYFKSGLHAKLLLAIAFAAGLNLLALGSRLGVITGLISVLIFYWYFASNQLKRGQTNSWMLAKVLAILVLSIVAMTSIGLIREGNGITFEGLLGIFSAEPLFIYVSVPAYLSKNALPLLAVPVDIFASMIAAVPSFLFPSKIDFFSTYSAIDKDSISGFGGVNHLISLITNFGLIGLPVAAFFEGAWFGMLIKNCNKSPFLRAVAISSISVVPFIMFREGFQTTIKIVFFNYLLFPYIATRVFFFLQRSVRGPARSM
jgi:hypothetical protein